MQMHSCHTAAVETGASEQCTGAALLPPSTVGKPARVLKPYHLGEAALSLPAPAPSPPLLQAPPHMLFLDGAAVLGSSHERNLRLAAA